MSGKDDPISHACRVAGGYTISAGTSNPAVALGRLLDALAILDPEAHRVIMEPGGEYASVPREALDDESHAWWSTESADGLLRLLFATINSAAPEGFGCMCGADDRIDLARLDQPLNSEESLSRPPPQFSALRARVRPPEG